MNYLNINTKGNKKLRNNESVRFMIWNLPSQKTCPFATEHCKKYCYAKKAERIYKNVLSSREKNLEESKKVTFAMDMILTISKLLNSKAYQGKKVCFRIHESGDFYSQEYFNKWLEIAKFFEYNENLVFLAYTKSIDFIHDLPSNFIIRLSIWDDTNINTILSVDKAKFPTYSAERLTAESIKNLGESYCDCNDCGTCGKCYDRTIKNIVCNIH